MADRSLFSFQKKSSFFSEKSHIFLKIGKDGGFFIFSEMVSGMLKKIGRL